MNIWIFRIVHVCFTCVIDVTFIYFIGGMHAVCQHSGTFSRRHEFSGPSAVWVHQAWPWRLSWKTEAYGKWGTSGKISYHISVIHINIKGKPGKIKW